MNKHLNIALAVTYISFYLSILSVLLHNFVSGLLGKEEPFFFFLSLISSLVFPLALVYSSIIWVINLRRERKEKKSKK